MNRPYVHFFVASRCRSQRRQWSGHIMTYVTLIRMAFTLTDQHRAACFDCRRWYSPFTYFRSKMSSWYEFMPSLTILSWCPVAHLATFSDESNRSRIVQSNRNCNSRFSRINATTAFLFESSSTWRPVAGFVHWAPRVIITFDAL